MDENRVFTDLTEFIGIEVENLPFAKPCAGHFIIPLNPPTGLGGAMVPILQMRITEGLSSNI